MALESASRNMRSLACATRAAANSSGIGLSTVRPLGVVLDAPGLIAPRSWPRWRNDQLAGLRGGGQNCEDLDLFLRLVLLGPRDASQKHPLLRPRFEPHAWLGLQSWPDIQTPYGRIENSALAGQTPT